jgi:hypothetical protein
MNGSELFDLWAPADAVWSPWAKPLLFAAAMNPAPPVPPVLPVPPAPPAPRAPVRIPASGSMAVIVDLPGSWSVEAGLDLAREGFRPVPLFNGAGHAGALVKVEPIVAALRGGASTLRDLHLTAEAVPAFLLDADRARPQGKAAPGSYDNRWLVFPQDFPSASFLQSRRIARVLLLQEAGRTQPAEDLAHVLRRWQEAGLEMLLAHPGEGGPPIPFQVQKPSRFRALSYRALALLGVHRNSAGGFGSVIPVAAAGSAAGFG